MHGTKARADNPITLSSNILNSVADKPNGNLSDLSQVVFYSKYSRYRDDMSRREYYAETSQRATEYNVNLAIAFAEERGILSDEFVKFHTRELDKLFMHQYGCKMSLSGRTLWIGGTDPSYINPMANFNCSFMVIDEWRKLGELMHLGMVGSGIGFRILKTDVEKLPKIVATRYKLRHKEYEPIPKGERAENSSMHLSNEGTKATIIIGDSKEGWRQSLDLFFEILTTSKTVKMIEFNYDNVRQAGEVLERFGGRAGGPDTIKSMYDTFYKVLTGKLDTFYPKLKGGKVRPIHVLDLANAIGKNIVSGDVRSIAEIALLDPEDNETIEAKSTIFNKKHLNHRYVSNNSVYYLGKPSREQLEWQFEQIRFNGEPCFVNAKLGNKRRPNFNGVNPCVEILLDDRGLCNLTTVNWMAFVKKDIAGNTYLATNEALEAFRMATRAGLRMTLPRLEIDEWDLIQQRDRLLGVSFTGYQDMVDAVGFSMEEQARLLDTVHETVQSTAKEYAKMLGVNEPLLTTCIKPEGTISQLFGGVSSGLHVSHASNFIRRVRSAQKDPISKAIFDHNGWTMHAEFYDGSQHEQIQELMQFVPQYVHLEPVGSEDSITPKTWTYKSGYLSASFQIKAKKNGGEKAIIDAILLWYGVNDGAVSVSYLEELNCYAVEFRVAVDDYNQVFGKSYKVVTEFPNTSPAKRTKANFSAIEQLEVYKMCLNHYTDHNPSNTISVRDEEWGDVVDWVDKNWDDMLAVSFLSLYDTPYPISPFEEVSASKISEMKSEMQSFDVKLLWKYDLGGDMEIVEGSCEGGFCPVR